MKISDTNINSKLRIVETELWDFNNGQNSVIEPTLKNADYTLGVAVFQIPFDFCSSSSMAASTTTASTTAASTTTTFFGRP